MPEAFKLVPSSGECRGWRIVDARNSSLRTPNGGRMPNHRHATAMSDRAREAD
jgi:hypothetical protein